MRGLLKFAAKRIAQAIPMLLAVSIIIYALLQAMPGDPLDMYLENPSASPEAIEAIKEAHGLNQPVYIQYLDWLTGILTGDWGVSINSQRQVIDVICERVVPTLQLTATSFLLALAIALPLGVRSAIKKGETFDNVTTPLTFFGISMPSFWFGLMLQLLFAVTLHWLPSAGRYSLGGPGAGSVPDLLRHLIMPSIVLALIYIASWTRYARSNYLEVLGQDYIRTARAKGLKERVVLFRHALRNALIPMVTVVMLDIPVLFSGAVITETVFAWPGMGSLFFDSLTKQDFPILMGILMVNAILVILSNLLADIIYAALDPRIKY
jgi:peptide/nickel transport system permease protein